MFKSIRKYGILVLVAMMVLTSCMDKNARKNNYPTPNVNFELPVGHVYTIDTLLTMLYPNSSTVTEFKFTEDASVYGVVIADETSGNLYKASFIEDNGKALELYMKSTSGLRIGDSVRVYLKGATLSEYSGTPQIQDLEPKNVTILSNGNFIDPIEISTLNVSDTYRCRLVKFNLVEFAAADRNNTYAPKDAYGQYNLQQYAKQISGNDTTYVKVDDQIVVRTSNYASFANNQLPQGNGSIIGILTKYTGSGTVWQFTIRSLSEVQMDNEPIEAPIINPSGSGTYADPYNITAGIENQYNDDQWIKGYIVGSANIATGSITSDAQISWGPEFTHNENVTNIILADKADERDINKCIVVYLPSDAASGIRSINLKDNPGNLGKTLKVHGDLKAYLGKSGMKNTNEYELN